MSSRFALFSSSINAFPNADLRRGLSKENTPSFPKFIKSVGGKKTPTELITAEVWSIGSVELGMPSAPEAAVMSDR